jgi:REG-2-like HAD superfamily hydrolase
VSRRLVVLDAAGTLLEPAGSIGEAYATDARAAGAELDPAAIERGFARAMRLAPPLAFGERPPECRVAESRAWWRTVAGAALAEAGELPAGFRFQAFFDLAWERFSRPGAWRVYEDVRPGLRALRARGVPLAVFSNWDARLAPLLRALGLAGYFCRVIVSAELAAAKPDVDAYAAAARNLRRIDSASGAPIMVGDRLDHDVTPAIAAGWDAIWLDRAGAADAPPGVHAVRDLRGLTDVLVDRATPAA